MMDSASLSKGVVVFKNNSCNDLEKGSTKENDPPPDPLWLEAYNLAKDTVDLDIQAFNYALFLDIVKGLVSYVGDCHKKTSSKVPAATILLGTNMRLGRDLFDQIKIELKEKVTPHVATLNSQDCKKFKNTLQSMITQFTLDLDEVTHLKKSHSKLSYLNSWYEDLYVQKHNRSPSKKQKTKDNKKVLVVMIPDYEGFCKTLLNKLLLCALNQISSLPFVFVFGVETQSNSISNTLDPDVSVNLDIKVFEEPIQSIELLNTVYEYILCARHLPFHLGGNVLKELTDNFLKNALSFHTFVANFQYMMVAHFSRGNAMALCRFDFQEVLQKFSDEDFNHVRHLPSFRKLVEDEKSPSKKLALLENNNYLKKKLKLHLKTLVIYLQYLPLFINCLLVLVSDLPEAPLNSKILYLYSQIVSEDLVESAPYQECLRLLKLISKHQLLKKLDKIKVLISDFPETQYSIEFAKDKSFDDILYKLEDFEEQLAACVDSNSEIPQTFYREVARKILKKDGAQDMETSNTYYKVRRDILNYFTDLFQTTLVPLSKFYFHEIFYFDDLSVTKHVKPSYQETLKHALSNPHAYLQCSCCKIGNESQIQPTMPDICIVYKLHLEYNKYINLYDWMQSFASVVDPSADTSDSCDGSAEKEFKVKPEVQARFTQAVNELEFLGFIKSVKKLGGYVKKLAY